MPLQLKPRSITMKIFPRRSRKLQKRLVPYAKNTIKYLALLSLFLAALILLSKTYNSFSSSSEKPSISIPVEKDELEEALERASMANKTVIITIINEAYVEPQGNDLSIFDLFLEGFWDGEGTRPLVGNLLVVSMDETAHEKCMFRRLNCYRVPAEGGRLALEEVNMAEELIEMRWQRTRFLLGVLKRGYNFIFTDTDILWLRNPFTRLINNEETDLEISTNFYNGSRSNEKKLINTGFYFIRSNKRTTSFFQKWFDSRKNSDGLKEQDMLVKLIQRGVHRKLSLNTRFLNTLYFSGFCKDSRNIRSAVTVHANCCPSIKAKVADLKIALRDWKRFKDEERDGASDSGNSTSTFRWSKHESCLNSWGNNALR